MFPINLGAWHHARVGARVLAAANSRGMGVVALKACARGRARPASADRAAPPAAPPKHVPEWKQARGGRFFHYTRRSGRDPVQS